MLTITQVLKVAKYIIISIAAIPMTPYDTSENVCCCSICIIPGI